MIRRAARRTTLDNPVVLFTENARRPRSLLGRLRQSWRQRVHDMVAELDRGRDHLSSSSLFFLPPPPAPPQLFVFIFFCPRRLP